MDVHAPRTAPSPVILLLAGCAADHVPDPGRVPLRWVRGHDGETWRDARAGLMWSLSLLGAEPPADGSALARVDAGADDATFILDLAAAGFDDRARAAMEDAVAPLLASEEVDQAGHMDLGRFLMWTLYAPGRYYGVTGACPTRAGWEADTLVAEPARYGVTTSFLVEGQRWVRFNPGPADVGGIGLLAIEGEGELDGNFVETEYETVDVMPNGQQRYAVYDADGDLIAAAAETPAGQPGKCMWCHEVGIQRGSPENAGVEGALSFDAFAGEAAAMDAVLAAWRGARATETDWSTYEVHEHGELIALQFLRPPPDRVAREWGVSRAEVDALGLPSAEDPEHPELGPLLWRADVDAAADLGWAPLPVPEDFREPDPLLDLEGADALAECG